ncbi:MAG: lysophospholipid acyltransferase family protein [Syntrophobacteraceae bacterium]
MSSILRSLWMWISTTTLITIWVPLLGLIRIFDRDPVRFRTGLWFRRLGATIIRINPAWRVHLEGLDRIDHSGPYLVASNHQSLADIPLLCLLPWEMKWIAKTELFKVPLIGWMMQMAGDIRLDRRQRAGAQALLRAKGYLQKGCSVMVFPEGTRSRDSRIHAFTDGAFALAIKAGVPVLPIAIEGSHDCLPKGGWRFGEPKDIHIRVLESIDTSSLGSRDASVLRDRVRALIIEQVAQIRGASIEAVDAALSGASEQTPSRETDESPA